MWHGLTPCHHGFGSAAAVKYAQRRCASDAAATADGNLTFASGGERLVEELDVLLAAGRLSEHTKAVIRSTISGHNYIGP